MSEYEDWGKDSDYLEELRRVLENLGGFATLGQEMLQNADDAGAKSVTFHVTTNALVVDNDATFSDCEHPEMRECPWRVDGCDRCDFHAFRRFSGASKRGRAGTTGAFGIGFTAVYQVTDQPELLSLGRHLIVDETLDPEKRIRACLDPGCGRPHNREGTRFILPWARRKDSALRAALGADPFTKENERELAEVFRELIPEALVFLRNVRTIELRVPRRKPAHWAKEPRDRRVLISGPSGADWVLCEADFEDGVGVMRDDYPDHLQGREAVVQVAIPLVGEVAGRFYATLPTADETGLGVHVNAEFFPTDDRRSLLWQGHPQADWNALAVEAAGTALAEAFADLREELGPERLWELLAGLRRAAPTNAKDRRESSLERIWEPVQGAVSGQASVWTADGSWVVPGHARLLRAGSPPELATLFCKLDLAVAHPSIAGSARQLGPTIGLEQVSLEDLVEALEPLAGGGVVESSELPAPLDRVSNRALLLEELARLRDTNRTLDAQLATLPLAPALSGSVGPFAELHRLDSSGIDLLKRLRLDVDFLDVPSLPEGAQTLQDLSPRADCRRVVEMIEAVYGSDDDWTMALENEEPGVLDQLIRWFATHKLAIADDGALRERIRTLPIWPTADGRRRLTELTLPGGRQERLPLSLSLHLTGLEDLRKFFREILDVKTLDLPAYCCTVLPARLDADGVTDEQRREVVLHLGRMKGQLVDDAEVQLALRRLPLTECADGEWRRADEAYLPSAELGSLLGNGYHQAVLGGRTARVIEDLLRWLGLTDRPREKDLVARIQALTTESPSARRREMIAHLLDELAARESEWSDEFIRRLSDVDWLPCTEDDKWHSPGDLYQREHFGFFSSQARFLDAPKQREKTDFLKRIGVRVQPPVGLVIKHISHAAEHEERIPWGAYDYVERRLEEADLSPLIGEPCIRLDDDGHYARPDEVFVRHPFGDRRHGVPAPLRKHPVLLGSLGVKELPCGSDALAMLEEIGTDDHCDGDLETALECWRLIQADLGEEVDGADVAALESLPVVPDPAGELRPPRDVLFDDDPALAARLGDRVFDRLIPRQDDTWRAMEAGGVRHLSDAAKPVFPGLRDEIDETPLRRHIADRRGLIARIVEDADAGSVSELKERLETLSFECSSHLVVRYEIDGDEGGATGYPVKALYLPETHVLCVAIQNGSSPWSDIAKELGRALVGEGFYRRIAGNLKAALEPDDMTEAAQDLDALGIRRLEETAEDSSWLEADAEPVPVEAVELDEFEVEHTDNGEHDSVLADEPGVLAEDESERDREEDGVPVSVRAGSASTTKGGRSDNGRSQTHERGGSATNGNGSDPTRAARGSKPAREPGDPLSNHYLETFAVVTPKPPNGTATRDELLALEIDKAGVKAVLAFEQAAGRDPERKPHSHPGFDVESFEGDELVRTIEVKSVDGAWDSPRVRLSDTQFAVATELGDRYWLYVVEHARSLEPSVWCIQDPARRVDRFAYVPEWKRLAEED
jgi:hypothetical protein